MAKLLAGGLIRRGCSASKKIRLQGRGRTSDRDSLGGSSRSPLSEAGGDEELAPVIQLSRSPIMSEKAMASADVSPLDLVAATFE